VSGRGGHRDDFEAVGEAAALLMNRMLRWAAWKSGEEQSVVS
jgi:hypothetical protein